MEDKLNWRTRLEALGSIRLLLPIIWEAHPVLFVAVVVAQFLRALLPLAGLWIPKLILDAIIAYSTRHEGDLRRIWCLVAAELAVAVLMDVTARVFVLCDRLLSERVTNLIGVRLMRHANALDLASFEDPVFYDKLERARAWAANRNSLLTTGMVIGQQLVTVLSLSAGLVVFSPWLVALLIASVLPAFAGEAHFTVMGYFLNYHRTARRRLLDYLCLLCSSLQSAKEVRIFDLGQHLTGKYFNIASDIYLENKQLAVKQSGIGAALNVLSICGYYGAYSVVLLQALSGAISIGTFTFLTGAFSRSRTTFAEVLFRFNDLAQNAVYVRDLFEFFETKPRIQSKPGARRIPRPIRRGFEFRHVTFSYSGSNRPVVQDLNFCLRPGQTVALIGVNGAGKTTIVKLLTRLYDPSEGEILLDGVDLREYSLEDLRNEMSVIFQDYVRFDLMARENIGFGKVDSLTDDRRIRQAAEQSTANCVVGRLPNGYDQMLGRRFEGGVDLSGGEWQSFALARAYMRDAQCFILDEPTATLDAAAEHRVFERFSNLSQNRMGVLISHRFNTVRMADRILVLDGGEICEEGSHEELMRLGGRYADLFSLQAAGYK